MEINSDFDRSAYIYIYMSTRKWPTEINRKLKVIENKNLFLI